MATSTITNTVKDASGAAVVGATITATLSTRGFRVSDNSEIAPQVSTTTDSGGNWSLALEQTANINPSGSYYIITEAIPVAQGGPNVWAIQVGPSSATLAASLVTPPPSAGSSTFLTQAVADARYLPLAGTSPDFKEFTSSGTWNKPANAKGVHFLIFGAGGGGGSGMRGAAGTARCGGGGGGGGGLTESFIYAGQLPGSLAVTVGTGGSGGAAITTDNTNGNNGTAGGLSSVSAAGIFLQATGGSGGLGGLVTGATPGAAPGNGRFVGTGGATSNTTGTFNAGSGATSAGCGGGGGGTVITANTDTAGGNGGANAGAYSTPPAGGSAGGGNGAAATSLAVNSPVDCALGGAGGGGGGSGNAVAGGSGGLGGFPGGGGGGGGGVSNGQTSGAGANGANGVVIIITYF